MKYLLLTALLLLSTSFSTNKVQNETWIGTMEVYMTDNKEFIIYYRGNYSECFTKYIIDKLFEHCDSINENCRLDSILDIGNVREIKPPKKITTM